MAYIPEHESPENFEEQREIDGMKQAGPAKQLHFTNIEQVIIYLRSYHFITPAVAKLQAYMLQTGGPVLYDIKKHYIVNQAAGRYEIKPEYII
jgi:hypothetical protein